ncbi:MAG: FHA domain-containing protein [Candidatus Parcubacteria bacterium]|nr:FHA domain-containing protein [Burkholderiales bacterium]
MSGLWNRISSAFERSDIGAGYDEAGGDEEGVRPTTTRYAPIRDAVERRITAFLRQDLVSHLEIGFNEIFLLHYMEIAADRQGEAELERFLHEFSPEARVQWVKKLLGPAVGRHVSVEQFLGLDREFAPEALAETDPFEEKLNQAATPLYRIILHGRWESGQGTEPQAAEPQSGEQAPVQPAVAEQSAPAPEMSLRLAGPSLCLSVKDAKAAQAQQGELQVIEIDRYPAVLGSSAQADVEITGFYVSARHCTLHWEGQQLWLADHSTNGTWVDGERVRRGTRVALANGALLGFGRDRGEGEHDRYPAVRAQLMRKLAAPGANATPVAPSTSTPIAPGVVLPLAVAAPAENAPLAVLSILDATGSPKRDVLKLPFSIGRGSAQDYVVPDANQGVSREHLVIEEINGAGAVMLNRAVGRNGTFAGSQPLPERFVWRFGQEIVLGGKWADAPAVRMSLQLVGIAA